MNIKENDFRVPKKVVEVTMPRLNMQIMHEWTTPAKKKIVEITDQFDKGMNKKTFLLA